MAGLAILAGALGALGFQPPSSAADPLDRLVARDLAFASRQLGRAASTLPLDRYPSRTDARGAWRTTGPEAWTSGFFPGELWLLYQLTHDQHWRGEAEKRQLGIEGQKTNTSTHDLGFMLFDSFGNGYRLTRRPRDRQVLLTAARSLATRYSPIVRSLRSWNNPPSAPLTDFRVIIDNMMNLELLFWASAHGGEPSWRSIAVNHAERTMQQHVRPDGSTYHVVIYDSTTGEVKTKTTAQGASADSTWSRGQAWALYGFTCAYRYTRDKRFLQTARRTADYFLAHLPSDHVPYWDFQAPRIPREPRDSSAAAIAASGLLELSKYAAGNDGARYRRGAQAIITSLSSPAYLAAGTRSAALLLHGTANRPAGRADNGLIWGDYYFIEALVRLRAASVPPALRTAAAPLETTSNALPAWLAPPDAPVARAPGATGHPAQRSEQASIRTSKTRDRASRAATRLR